MRKILIFFFGIMPFVVQAQTQSATVNFKTPEVTMFNKNIETPVSLYTGVPNISIPLYEVNIKGVNVPITLDYHAGGIRVEEEATWVGLGWNLNYGGAISRKVRGAPDEKYFVNANNNNPGTINHFLQLPANPNIPDGLGLRIDYIRQSKYGNGYDYMPDEFYYSALGSSGKFMFSQEKNKFITFPKEDIGIQNLSGNGNPLYSFNLNLPNGVSVDFGGTAYAAQKDMPKTADLTRNAWYINNIKNLVGENIAYTYEQFDQNTYKFSGASYSIHSENISSNGLQTSYGQARFQDARLKNIVYPQGTLNFITSYDRADLSGKALNEIDVLDNNGTTVKKILFTYSYFYGNAYDVYQLLDGSSYHVPDSYRYNRLKLDAITIIDKNQAITKKYSFEYNTNAQMPSKYSFAQDHWGYYNGIANTTANSFIPNVAPEIFTGGDRRVNPATSNVFSLKSITYPEGGKTELIYENNTARVSGLPTSLLQGYQDDNFIDKSANINVSGWGRNSFYPTPNSVNSCTRVFKNQFTVGSAGSSFIGNGWHCSTNYGVESWENTMPYNVNNVEFKLEKLNTDGTRTVIKTFNTTNTQYPCSSIPCPRVGVDDKPITMAGGNYEMTVSMTYCSPDPNDQHSYNLYFSVKWREINPLTKMIYTGGLRIKDINYYSSDNQLAKKKTYSYTNPYADASLPTYTSGRVVSLPLYWRPLYQDLGYSETAPPKKDWTTSFYSNSLLSLETTSGSYSGYEYVDEYDVDYSNAANSLKTNYHYSFDQPYFSQYYNYMHLGAWEPNEWTRGKLLNKRVYKGNNIVQQEDYTYNAWSPHLQNQTNEDYVQEINTDFISFQYISLSCYCNPYSSPYPADFFDVDYNQPFIQDIYGVSYLCLLYNYGVAYYHTIAPSNSGTNCTSDVSIPYFIHYTGFDKPKSKTTTTYDDNGKSLVTTENYSYEKTPTINQLTKTSTVNSKGETIDLKLRYPTDFPSDPVLSNMANAHILSPVVETEVLKNNTSLKLTRTNYSAPFAGMYMPQTLQQRNGSNALETEITYNSYDNTGNLLQYTGKDGVVTAVLWGYKKQYPVAKVVGKNYADLLSQSAVNVNILDNPSSDAALRTELNKLRTVQGALVSTYTYVPLVGISSETDANNKTKYYEYDASNRLILIRDQDKNVLKTFCYNYFGQPIDCRICTSFTADWQNTLTPLRCQLNGCNYTGYQEQEQKDMNSCSSTYNQLRWVQATYNPTACPATSLVPIIYQSGAIGFTATYTNNTTGQVYTFPVPAGTGTLGCIPAGSYFITITNPNSSMVLTFGTGCQVVTGTSGNFRKTLVSTSSCNQINISADQ